MKKLAFLLVSGLFACANLANAATVKVSSLLSSSTEDQTISQQQNEQLILEPGNADNDRFNGHYSHSSHRSHESHYSHRSHYSSRY